MELKADRLSCKRFLTNLSHLLLHTVNYSLFWLLRKSMANTELTTAQLGTLRLKLLKISARIHESTRRIWIHFVSAYPYQQLLIELMHRLRAVST